MKKLFLLLTSCSIVLAAGAQERTLHAGNSPMPTNVNLTKYLQEKQERATQKSGLAGKKTAAGRWYDYASYFVTNAAATSATTDYTFPITWGKDNALCPFSDGAGGTIYDTVNFISYAMMYDPAYGTAYNGFNNPDYYLGATKITASDAFSIDTVMFSGLYATNPAKSGASGFIDTLRVAVIYGPGNTAAGNIRQGSLAATTSNGLMNFGLAAGDPLKYEYMLLDAARMKAAGSPVYTTDILLDNTTTPTSWAADTVEGEGVYIRRVAIPGGFNVPAGNMVGISVSFISGDNTFTGNDTLLVSATPSNVIKYNFFRPTIFFKGADADAEWLTYVMADRNTGGYAGDVAGGVYSPHWFWTSGSDPATLQYPDISFHVGSCATCGTVIEEPTNVTNVNKMKVAAYPNPAVSELNVPFVIGNNAAVTVTLSNMLGQVVAVKNMGTVSNGTAVFNTNSLPDGIYTYTVTADGQRTTGNVAIAH